MPYSLVTLHIKFERNQLSCPRDTRFQKLPNFSYFFFFAALINPFKNNFPLLWILPNLHLCRNAVDHIKNFDNDDPGFMISGQLVKYFNFMDLILSIEEYPWNPQTLIAYENVLFLVTDGR